jgi:hypothetical protein
LKSRGRLLLSIVYDFLGRGSLLVLSVGLLVSFFLWPVAVFWSRIKFDAAKFTEEWIKLTFGGLAVLLVIEIAKRRQEEIANRRADRVRLMELFVRPTRSLLALLGRLTPSAKVTNPVRGALLPQWDLIASRLNAEQLGALIPVEDLPGIQEVFAVLNPGRCRNIITSLDSAVTADAIASDELTEVRGRLEDFARACETYLASPMLHGDGGP